MRLSEFQIKNFRSIVNTGWNTLSSDNITAFIGQNESGKTSVLEALYSFYEGSISEDVLRSDLSMPEISCSYTVEHDVSFDLVDNDRMPPGVLSAIKASKKIVLTRKWYPDLTSRTFLSGKNVTEIFEKIEQNERCLIESVIKQINELFDECTNSRIKINRLEESIISHKKELEIISKKQAGLKKLLKRSSGSSKKETLTRNKDNFTREYDNTTEKIKEEQNSLDETKIQLADKDFIREYSEKCLELLQSLEKGKPELENTYQEITGLENSMTQLKNEKEKKAGRIKLFQSKERYIKISRQLKSLEENAGYEIRLIKKLIGGKELSEAEREAKNEFNALNKLYSIEEAGEVFFRHIPRHEFFEDFSSLLPNRIDLEDIFENNTRAEGYKAVRNFLIIAGLDPEFFQQINNRILKQKIENLNNEITVDFQEYWRQNVGKTNKIRIHFELEHYDVSNPEKKGRPYLEFWIKDQHERLYPNQRSRGVRWFLSFYLELKAFAKENENMHRVLLIDEPGLSLHARAQEDVLKIFEDIKGKIQIIYTTHSPHLIDLNKLYRLLGVQRAHENREQSETILFDSSRLYSATSDTLSPVCSLMGTGFTRQEFVRQSKNIIVEDISSFYYLSSLYKLTNNPACLYFLPANGPAGVTTLVNLLTGWGFDFSVLLFDSEDNNSIIHELHLQLKCLDLENPDSRLQFTENIPGPEDLFSTLDFKKHIIKKRIGISGTNSEFIRQNDISRPFLAAGFSQTVSTGKISFDDFDEETRSNLTKLFDSLVNRVRTWDETG